MEPMAMPKTTTAVRCEKHGLHYDPAKVSGCVLCRRESGELPPPRAASAAAPSGGSLGAALAVTALLVGATTFAMQMVHSTFIEWLRNTGNPSAYETGNTYQQEQMDGALKELEELGSEGGVALP